MICYTFPLFPSSSLTFYTCDCYTFASLFPYFFFTSLPMPFSSPFLSPSSLSRSRPLLSPSSLPCRLVLLRLLATTTRYHHNSLSMRKDEGMVRIASSSSFFLSFFLLLLLLLLSINSYSASRDNWCTVGGNGGCRVGEVRAGTTSPMSDHKGFKLQ